MATTISSGRGNSPLLTANIADHGTIYGGRGLEFDGVTDYLNFNTRVSNLDGNDWSLSAWVKPTTNKISVIWGQSTGGYGIKLMLYDDGRVLLQWRDSGNSARELTSVANTATVGNWCHVAVTWESQTKAVLYVNGENVSEHTTVADVRLNASSNIDAQTRDNFLVSYQGGSYPHLTLSDLKRFDCALTEAQVQELYLKPEQSAPSAVQDNLVAWYPMCEGNPDSPQSIVYDHSEKGLGAELVTNGTDWTDSNGDGLADNWTNQYIGKIDLSIVTGNGFTGNAQRFEANAVAGSDRAIKTSATVFTSGTLYKVSFKYRASKSSGSILVMDGGSGATVTNLSNHTGDAKLFETYYVAPSGSHLWFYMQSVDEDAFMEIDEVSVKEVLMGNHATTEFHGVMSDLLSAAQKTFFADILDPRDNVFDFGGNNADGATTLIDSDGFTASNATFAVASTKGLLTNNASAQGLVSLPITTVAGKSYQVKVFTGTQNSNVEVSLSTSTSFNASNTTGAIAASQTDKALVTAYVADDTSSFLVIRLSSSTNTEYANLDDIRVGEVGVLASGFATAQEEPTIPQVPLLRYNEKAVLDDVDDYVSMGDVLDIVADFTVSAWVICRTGGTIIGSGQPTSGSAGNDGWKIGSTTFELDGAGQASHTSLSHTDIADNKLHHIVSTRSGNDLKVYIDGILDASTTGSAQGDLSNARDLAIGASHKGGATWESHFGGIIDDVSMFNTALSATEVQELFADGVALDATTHSKAGNLLGYWRNDGISSWADRRGWSYLNFDGTGDTISLGAGKFNFDSDADDFTISIWAKYNGSSQGILISRAYDSGEGWEISSGSSSRLYFNVGGATANWTGTDGSGAGHQDNTWHLYTLVNYDDSGTQKFIGYVDGVSRATGTSGSEDVGLTYHTRIGGRDHGAGSLQEPFTGDIAQASVYNKALSVSEVLSQYNLGINSDWSSDDNLQGYWKMTTASTSSGAIKDLTVNGNNGTSAGDPTLNDGNNGTPAGTPESIIVREGLNSNKDGLGFPFKNADRDVLRLDGAKDYISVPDSDGLTVKGSFTLEFWYKQDMPTVNQDIIASDDNSNRNFGVRVLSNGKMFFIVWSGGSTTSITTDNAVTDGNWKHITCVLTTGTSMTIWVDGVSTKTSTSSIPTTIDDDPTPFKIGTKTTTSEMFKGLVDEIRFYHKALSSAEISKNYKHGKGKHKN